MSKELLKRSRYYMFGDEDTIWYKDDKGIWRLVDIVNGEVDRLGGFRSPWSSQNDQGILDKLEYHKFSYVCFSEEEYEDHMFLHKL